MAVPMASAMDRVATWSLRFSPWIMAAVDSFTPISLTFSIPLRKAREKTDSEQDDAAYENKDARLDGDFPEHGHLQFWWLLQSVTRLAETKPLYFADYKRFLVTCAGIREDRQYYTCLVT